MSFQSVTVQVEMRRRYPNGTETRTKPWTLTCKVYKVRRKIARGQVRLLYISRLNTFTPMPPEDLFLLGYVELFAEPT